MSPIRHAPAAACSFFDPYNSSSTGHQRAENRLAGSSSWRDSRSHKLAQQLGDGSGRGGETHLSDTVGAGSQHFGNDGRKQNGSWEVGGQGLRENGSQDIRCLIGKRKRHEIDVDNLQHRDRTQGVAQGRVDLSDTRRIPLASLSEAPLQSLSRNHDPRSSLGPKTSPSRIQIFRSLALYLNGSTFASGISDQRLKSLFVQHGGSVSISLGRRTVTHVILSSGNTGLAAGKIQREVAKVGGKGVKYVTAEWVVDSVNAGKKLPENRYQAAHIAMKGQPNMLRTLDRRESKRNDDKHRST